MSRLVINPGTANSITIPLGRGITSFGRGQQNHHVLEDTSVSGAHFEVSITNSGVIVRDLGSTNGTFIDGQRITESILLSGQVLQAGSVRMQYEADFGGLAEKPKSAIAPPVPAHSPTSLSHKPLVQRKQRKEEQRPFIKEIPGALTYPLHGDGLLLLIGGSIFFGIMGFVAAIAFYVGRLLGVFVVGYLVVYAQEILRTSANGGKRMPHWPDIEGTHTYVSPIFHVLGVAVISFGPAMLIKLFHPADNSFHATYYWTALLLGCLYFPMSITAVTLFDSLTGASPLLIVPSIFRAPIPSLLASFVLMVGFGANSLASHIRLPIPLLGGFISGLAQIYCLSVAMRICGLLYWTQESKLGWFGEKTLI